MKFISLYFTLLINVNDYIYSLDVWYPVNNTEPICQVNKNSTSVH